MNCRRPFVLCSALAILVGASPAFAQLDVDGPATENAPTEDAPTENAPTENAPTENAPTENAPTENAPTENAPTENAPAENAPAENAPTENAPSLALRCLDDTAPDTAACLKQSAILAAKGQTDSAAALAEHACMHGALEGCSRAGLLLLPEPTTRPLAKTLLERGCTGGEAQSCLVLGDAERGGLFGSPNPTAAITAYQKGCAIERTTADAPTAEHGPLCAALVDTLGEDPFAPSSEATQQGPTERPPTEAPKQERPQRPTRKPSPPQEPRLDAKDDTANDPLLTARARFPLGAFVLEGGGRLLLGASTNPWRFAAPANAPVPILHGGAATLTFAPVGRIRFDLIDLVGANLEVGADWTGFIGADVGVPGGGYANALAGGYFIDAELGLGRDVVGLPIEENGSDRNLLSVRNRTRARLTPGRFLSAVDVGTSRNERKRAAPTLAVPLAPGAVADLMGVSENLFNLEARLDFLINLEFGYAFTRQRVDVINPVSAPQTASDALSLPLFFLPTDLGEHGFEEHAGRIRGGLSLPKFDFFGPAHLFGEFSLARRGYRVETFYPSTARAGVDATAEIFEVRADAGAANTGRTQVFGSDTHFVGGLSIAVPIGARWWVTGDLERRLLSLSITDWGLTTTGGVLLQNRGRATAISVFARGGMLEFGVGLPQTTAPSDAIVAQGGARAELRFGPFRPSVEVDLQTYFPRTNAAPTSVGEVRFGIGF